MKQWNETNSDHWFEEFYYLCNVGGNIAFAWNFRFIMLKEFVQWSKFIGSFCREIIQLAGMSNVASYLQNGQV